MSKQTPVIFRKARLDGGGWEIVAIFPNEPARPGKLGCYAHMGQHAECSVGWYRNTKKAEPHEYEALRKELVSIGYDDLVVRQRLKIMC